MVGPNGAVVANPSYLYSGSLLQAAAETAARIGADPARHPPLSQTERDFLHASDRARQGSVRRRRAVIAGLLALTLTALTAAGIAVHNAGTAGHNAASATRQHAIALSRQLAAESLSIDPADPVTARRLAAAAWRVSPTDQASSAMATLLTGQQQNGILPATSAQDGVSGVAFSPDGKLLASVGGVGDGTLRLWNPLTGHPADTPLPADPIGVSGVAFSPDGKLLASAGYDGTVRLWNPLTGHPAGAPLHATSAQYGVSPQGGVYGVAFSPDGKPAGQRQRRRHGAAVGSIAIRAPLCGALRRRRPANTARLGPVRLRRTATQGLRLNPGNADFHHAITSRTQLSHRGARRSTCYRCTLIGPLLWLPLELALR